MQLAFPIIDADAHFCARRRTWLERIARCGRDRAPRQLGSADAAWLPRL
jgi:hypothetical protein